MKQYFDFMEWHVDRVRQQPYPGNTFDYMEFPIRWERSRPLIEHLHYIFKAYIAELKEFGAINENVISDCKKICESILRAMSKAMHYQRGHCVDDVDTIGSILQFGKFIRPVPEKDDEGNNKDVTLYRMRGKKNLTAEEEFYHIPFDSLGFSNTERFSVMGHPCLYLGYSKEGCLAEIACTEGTMAEFSVKKELKVVDLTIKAINDSNDMFCLWPVLAACYVAVPRPEEKEATFKEEYVFPQILTSYFMEYGDNVDGIKFYSCRYPKLDPQKETYMNLVLYSRMEESGHRNFCNLDRIPKIVPRYDDKLMGKLKVKKIYNI